jgi:P-type Ca2+ transporter type 2C
LEPLRPRRIGAARLPTTELRRELPIPVPMDDNKDHEPTSSNDPARSRAPTISVDGPERPLLLPRIQTDGLTEEENTPSHTTASPTAVPHESSQESNQSRPTSPHNVSSPTHKHNDSLTQNFLAVPGTRSRTSSVESNDSRDPSSYGGDTYISSAGTAADEGKDHHNNDRIMNDKDALKPDPQTESDFHVEDNKFAFSPGQLNKMINPKNLAAFYALGGLAGLEKGLRTDRHSGLSVDEVALDGTLSFDEAVRAGSATKDFGPVKRSSTAGTMGPSTENVSGSFHDRKRIFRDNRLPQRKGKSIWELAWIAYNDKVLILLTAAAVISLALGIYQTLHPRPGDHEARVAWVEGVAIVVAIAIVVLVGAANDWRKERQFVKLNRRKEERFVKVIRSGKSREISVYDVLVGDNMHLEPGDLIPVDGVFISGHNVRCDESSATGESDIIKKTPADEVFRAIENHDPVNKMDPFILSGGKVSEGVGNFLVTSVGVNSSYGKTLMSLQDEGQTTPLQSKLNVLAEYIAKLGLAAGLLLFIVLFIKFLAQLKSIVGGSDVKGQQFLQIFIVAVTIVVVAVPEGLPLAVTLALAFATTRMLRDNNLVRLLRACETMGNATTICSDKTGTLTQNKMSVVVGTVGTSSRFNDTQNTPILRDGGNSETRAETPCDAEGISSAEFTSTLSKEVKELLRESIVLNSTAFEAEENGKVVFVGSKTETALLDFAKDRLGIGSVAEERANAETVQMIPFDSGRKCMAIVIKTGNGRYRMFVKGASEILIARCTKIVRDPTQGAEETPLSADNMETLNAIIKNYASRSLRTIGLLYRDYEQWPPRGAPTRKDDSGSADFDKIFKDMVFLGIVGIQDPLRPGVSESVAQCQVAGVFVRMVTGDNLTTAKAIATECGIFTAGGIAMEGPIFRKLTSKQMTQIIPRLQVLARSSPEDKRILVKHLKKLGETVAVTGDGTNDAPALKAADVGFSMGIAGTEVAKEASAIILMDDNFSSIVKAVSWGRTVNDAVKKFLQVNFPRFTIDL